MHFFPFLTADLYDAVMTGSGTVTSGSDDEAYQLWAEAMAGYAASANSAGLPASNFWIVIRLPAKDFSDTLEMHQKLPLMVPREGVGVLVGFARTPEELDEITAKDSEKYIYLTYKIKLQGQHAWRTLLDFLGEHDMLDKQDA